MRELKKGDRCEARVMATDDLKPKLCNVRHMEGSPPRQLLICVRDKKKVFLCSTHQNVTAALNAQGRQRRKRQEMPEQIDLVTCANVATDPDDMNSGNVRCATVMDFCYGLPPMPE